MKTEIRFDRLKKLANHLIKGKLDHEKFDFYIYNNSHNNKYKRNGCGTVGCAIGECPIVFPKYWCFSRNMKNPKLKTLGYYGYSVSQSSGLEFFNLVIDEYSHLFMPNHQYKKYGGRKLSENATSKMVGNNILAFIKKINSN